MGVSTRGRLRRFWFQVHMWIGVGLFLVLIPLSLTGSYLVWRDDFDRALYPARYAVTGPAALPPSAYLTSAQAAFGDRARASAVRLPAGSADPVTVQGALARRGEGRPGGRPQMLTAWLDPATGKVLEVANPRAGLSMWMHDLHGQLFVFGAGRQIVGWLGWLMLVSCLTGLWLWWPKAGPLTLGLRWRRGPGPLINLHYLTGFWIALPLAVLSLTGALISFPPVARTLVGAFAPLSPQAAGRGGPGRGFAPPLKTTALTADQAAAAAQALAPGGRLVSVSLPTRGPGQPGWRVQISLKGFGPVTVQVPDAAGAPARLQAPAAQLGGDRLLRLNRQVHDGDDTPLIWKLVITLAGIAPALLGITGVIVWADGQRRKAALRRPAVPAPVPAE